MGFSYLNRLTDQAYFLGLFLDGLVTIQRLERGQIYLLGNSPLLADRRLS